jgi:hypothetical protein
MPLPAAQKSEAPSLRAEEEPVAAELLEVQPASAERWASPQAVTQPLDVLALQMALPAALEQLAVELAWQREARQTASPLRAERWDEALEVPLLLSAE